MYWGAIKLSASLPLSSTSSSSQDEDDDLAAGALGHNASSQETIDVEEIKIRYIIVQDTRAHSILRSCGHGKKGGWGERVAEG